MLKSRAFYFVVMIMVVVASLVVLAIIRTKPRHQISAPAINTIIDNALGLRFHISKKFQPIPHDQLASLNPAFAYGFRPIDDANAECIIAQSPQPQPVRLTSGNAGAVIDGIVSNLKQTHPDVTVINSGFVPQFGQAPGVLTDTKYTDGAISIRRVEVAAVSKTHTTFAYCLSRSQDNSKYRGDFTTFFSSLQVNS